MKIKIRNGVFETNSSSTHSFTIATKEQKEEMNKKYAEIVKRLHQVRKDAEESRENGEKRDSDLFIEERKLMHQAGRYAVSFEIRSPLAKLVWLKGIIDNAGGEKKVNYYVRANKDGVVELTSKNKVLIFYDLLKEEYCKMEKITKKKADERILLDGNRILVYEKILEDEKNLKSKVDKIYSSDYDFSVFIEKNNYEDRVEAFRDYVKVANKRRCDECEGRLCCDHYFSEGALDYCDCGFENFYAIDNKLFEVMGDLSLVEFAKEFITDKYSILGTENWNNCCVLRSDDVY